MKRLKIVFITLTTLVSGCDTTDSPEIENPFSTNYSSGREFLNTFQPEEQVFQGDAFPIVGLNGTTMNISGPYISLQTNDTLVGEPMIQLTEYRTKFDMLFAGLPTEFKQRMLESAGAFKLRIEVNGIAVRATTISYFVPSTIANSTMQLFYGSSDSISFWAQPYGLIGTINMTESPSFGYTGSINPVHQYLYEQGAMYINCDYLTDNGYPVQNRSHVFFRVASQQPILTESLTITGLFPDYNAYMNAYWREDSSAYRFYRLPIGATLQCLVIGVSESQELMYAIKSVTVSAGLVDTVTLSPISESDLQSILEDL